MGVRVGLALRAFLNLKKILLMPSGGQSASPTARANASPFYQSSFSR
jgi:hypothetical protein